MKLSKKMLAMEIRKLLPDEWSYGQKLQFLEKLCDEYRKKSREDVYKAVKDAGKSADYSAIQNKEK